MRFASPAFLSPALRLPALASLLLLACAVPPSRAQDAYRDSLDRVHSSPEWTNIASHLPDPATATAAKLEIAADTLRARRYPQDALRFYSAAAARGGNPLLLFKKMGIACLEMQQIPLARTYFKRAVGFDKRDASAWNNLGAADFILHDTGTSIRDYKKAVKLDKSSAVFHANLALAYFEARHMAAARKELAKGLGLDPDLLHKNGQSGYTAQVLASERYSEICFEMARIYAAQGNTEAVLEWLTKASDRGYDVRGALNRDATLRPLLADARVLVLLKNTEQMQARAKPPKGIPTLGKEQ